MADNFVGCVECGCCNTPEEYEKLQTLLAEKDKRIAELEAQLPKWHKVSEGDLPKECDYVYCVDELASYILCFTPDGLWNDGRGTLLELQEIAMWCELPQPPKEG